MPGLSLDVKIKKTFTCKALDSPELGFYSVYSMAIYPYIYFDGATSILLSPYRVLFYLNRSKLTIPLAFPIVFS